MNVNDPQVTNFTAPTLQAGGLWLSLGGAAVNASLAEGAVQEALSLLGTMDEASAKIALVENGFEVPAHAVDMKEILDSVAEALYATARAKTGQQVPTSVNSFAAKDEPRVCATPPYSSMDAKSLIAAVMAAPSVAVELTGSAEAHSRASMLMLAGQAIAKNVQGFAFDGLPGKFEVALDIAQIGQLYRASAGAVAEQSARVALGRWSQGEKATDLHEWVPDSVQRLLLGTVTMASASAVVHAIEGGTIARHANEIGTHAFASLLASQGVDVDAKTIDQQAADLEISLVDPERNRGQYVGKVVGLDHRAALVKFNRHSAIELSLAVIPSTAARPVLGDTVRVGFKAGVVSVSVADRSQRDVSER